MRAPSPELAFGLTDFYLYSALPDGGFNFTEEISLMKKSIIAAAAAALMISGQAAMADGKATYDTACFACHMSGAAGAPKFGDKAAWAPRIAKGLDVLKDHAIKGFKGDTGFMPAKGGRADLSDDAVAAAVEYMVSSSK